MIIRVSRLCFLATQANDEPHISLMTFSYYTTPEEDVIVFTMRRDTKKYQQIMNNHKVDGCHDIHTCVVNKADDDDQTDSIADDIYTVLCLTTHLY